jgi:CRISPR-associated protein Csb2
MIGISMTFLAGRFHATPWGHHVNEGAVEYPPSLWRLLRSLVATFYRARPSDVSEEQLTRIINALAAPPVFRLPLAATAHTRHYDAANGGIKFFDTFISLDPKSPLVWLWKDADLDVSDCAALAALLESLGTFGRAESWCEATLLDNASAEAYFAGEPFECDESGAWSAPLGDDESLRGCEPVRVLMPDAVGAELMKALLDDTGAMRKRKQLEPTNSRWMTYTRPLDLLTPRQVKLPRRRHRACMTVARFALNSNVLPLVQDTLPFCESVRWAILKFRKTLPGAPFSEVLTGKETNASTPLKGHGHAHYLATDEDGDGRTDHVTIYAARGFDEHDLEALGRLRKIYRHGETHEVFTALTGLGEVNDFADKYQSVGSNAPILQAAQQWRSVTPFVLPRFATRGAGKGARPRDTAIEQLRREAHVRGLPEIISFEETKGYIAKSRPLVRWLEFKTRRLNGRTGYGLAGFEIKFAKEVQAPLALGFGAHFGLGLFEPVLDTP